MKDHGFYLAMSYAALVVGVLIEAYRLRQHRGFVLRARALEREAELHNDGSAASTPTMAEHAPAFKEALAAVQEASRPQRHSAGLGRPPVSAEAARTGVDHA